MFKHLFELLYSEVVESPPFQLFKICLDKALNNLISIAPAFIEGFH